MQSKLITIVAPCYNEEDNVEDVHKKLKGVMNDYGKNYEILFVDDGSTDSTESKVRKIIKRDGHARLVRHKKNMGLGIALQTGFKNSRGNAIITIDADMTHDLTLIPSFVREIEAGNDVVIGSRYVTGGGMTNVPLWRVLVSKFANFCFRLIFWQWKVKDTTSGYRAYSRMIKRLNVESNGFPSQLEILVKMERLGAKVKEIPIMLVVRSKGQSKFRLFKYLPSYFRTVVNLFLRKNFG